MNTAIQQLFIPDSDPDLNTFLNTGSGSDQNPRIHNPPGLDTTISKL